MNDYYIRKQDAVDALKVQAVTMLTWAERYAEQRRGILTAINIVEDVEPADVVPVVHGKWTKLFYDSFNCNKCGSTFVIMQGRNNMYYCPNCGAKMDGERKEKYDG